MGYVKNFPDGDVSSVERSLTKSSWRIDSNREANYSYQSSLSELDWEGEHHDRQDLHCRSRPIQPRLFKRMFGERRASGHHVGQRLSDQVSPF